MLDSVILNLIHFILIGPMCHHIHSVHCIYILDTAGPVVFYKGFTRAFLDGNTETTEQLLASVVQSVEDIECGKKLVIIDGNLQLTSYSDSGSDIS